MTKREYKYHFNKKWFKIKWFVKTTKREPIICGFEDSKIVLYTITNK